LLLIKKINTCIKVIVAAEAGNIYTQQAIEIVVNNLDDNGPIFIQKTYEWHVNENTRSGTLIGRVMVCTKNVLNYYLSIM
jgi:hypothetical protein